MTTTNTVMTPTIRQASRAWRFWVIVGVVAILVAFASILISGAVGSGGPPLSPTNASPEGSKALAQVLRQQGVTVTATTTMEATRTAATSPSDTTIFVVDGGHFLDANQLNELGRLSRHLIVMTPDFDQLDALAPEVALAGDVSGVVTADCTLRSVTQAGSVTGTGSGYRMIGTDPDALQCLDSGDNVHSLIQLTHNGALVTVVGTSAAFSNQFVINEGNAAFALGLLGDSSNLVWLLPSIDEAAGPTAADLTPAWVSVVIVMLIIVTIAAGFWRGRRFGPLVVENLPVVVRSSETMQGRARLYEKSSSRLHALDALRIGTIDRLGAKCGLPRSSSVDDIIRAVAAITHRPAPEIAHLLRDADPLSDADLVRLSDALLDLEGALDSAVQPQSTTIDSSVATTVQNQTQNPAQNTVQNTVQPTEPGE